MAILLHLAELRYIQSICVMTDSTSTIHVAFYMPEGTKQLSPSDMTAAEKDINFSWLKFGICMGAMHSSESLVMVGTCHLLAALVK